MEEETWSRRGWKGGSGGCFCQGGGVQFSYVIIIFWGGKEGFNTPHFFGPSPGSATIAGLMLQMGESNV